MDKISPLGFNGAINNESSKTQEIKKIDIPNDSFEYSDKKSKNKKNTGLKLALGIGIAVAALVGIFLALKKGKVSELSFDDFKKKGGKFDKGKAIQKNGKPFNGKLTKETSKGDKFVVDYKNGLMQKSTKNFSDLVDEYSVKEYSYSKEGRLKEVINKNYKINETRKNLYDDWDEDIKQYADKQSLYDEKITSKTIYDDKKISTFVTDFSKTAEGKRRAKMTDEEINAEVQNLFDEVMAQKGIDKSVTPKIKLIPNENIAHGGSYNQATNTLELNPNSYRAGIFDLENVVAHEGTHFEEALLRSRLDDNIVAKAAKDKLVSRIYKGEADEIIVKGSLLGTETMKSPKLSEKMKKEFQKFAENNLYTEDKNIQNDMLALVSNKGKATGKSQEELLAKITQLVDDNPDFIAQYSSKEEAIEMLTKYSMSHNARFSLVTSKTNLDVSRLSKLTPEEEKRALESLDGFLETMEGNARISGFKLFGNTQEEFNNYQFSREEVLAQQNGNEFNIKKLKAKIEQMKKDGTLTPQFKAYFEDLINRSKMTIEYKTKGQVWYQKFIQSLNSPNDKILKEAVDKEWEELLKMQQSANSQFIPTGVWERVGQK